MAAARSATRARGRRLAAARRRALARECASASRPRTRPLYVTPLFVVAAGCSWLEPLLFPVSRSWRCALRVGRPRAVRAPRRRSRARASHARRDGAAGAHGAGAARRPAGPRARASFSGAPAWRSSAAAWACGWWVRRVRCSCAPAAGACTPTACASTDADLPRSDRIAHLLLALREDEARLRDRREPRVRRGDVAHAPPRCRRSKRPALDAAARAARSTGGVDAPIGGNSINELKNVAQSRIA